MTQIPTMKNKEVPNEPEYLGFCSYCKEPILEEDDFVQVQKTLIHLECYKQMHNFVEELEF